MAEEIAAGRFDLAEAASTSDLASILGILQKDKDNDKAAVRKSQRQDQELARRQSSAAIDRVAALDCRGAVPLQRLTQDDRNDKVYLVEDVTRAPALVHWQAVLLGGILCTSHVGGPALAFFASVSSRRILWLSDGFVRDNRGLSQLLLAGLERASSKWQLAQSRQHFLQRAVRVKNVAVLLLTDPEKSDEADELKSLT